MALALALGWHWVALTREMRWHWHGTDGTHARGTGWHWLMTNKPVTTKLERDLEASLWALCTGIEPMNYQMDVLRHIPHMRGSNERIRRMTDDHVLILCVCKTAMRFPRCQYVSYTNQVQCAEECLADEGIFREDVLCSFHRKERAR